MTLARHEVITDEFPEGIRPSVDGDTLLPPLTPEERRKAERIMHDLDTLGMPGVVADPLSARTPNRLPADTVYYGADTALEMMTKPLPPDSPLK